MDARDLTKAIKMMDELEGIDGWEIQDGELILRSDKNAYMLAKAVHESGIFTGTVGDEETATSVTFSIVDTHRGEQQGILRNGKAQYLLSVELFGSCRFRFEEETHNNYIAEKIQRFNSEDPFVEAFSGFINNFIFHLNTLKNGEK